MMKMVEEMAKNSTTIVDDTKLTQDVIINESWLTKSEEA